jgi:hypothetical protein
LTHFALLVDGFDVTPVRLCSRPARRLTIASESDLPALAEALTALADESASSGLSDDVRKPLLLVKHEPGLAAAIREACAGFDVHLAPEPFEAASVATATSRPAAGVGDLLSRTLAARYGEGSLVRLHAERLLRTRDKRAAVEEMLLGWLGP